MAAKSAGRKLRESILAGLPEDWELDEREEALLTLAAAQADTVAKLEALLKREGMLTTGSAGQPVIHPALAEARLGRLAIDRLLGKLVLPDPEAPGAGADASTLRGREAAKQRWSKEKRKEARRGAA